MLSLSMFAVATPAFAAASITLTGANPQAVNQGQSYSDPGFSAFSTFDGDITGSVITSGPNMDISGIQSRFYSVTDSNGDVAGAVRTVNVQGGGTMPFCSNPLAPGWQVGVIGGGCGGTEVLIAAGTADCPFWFPSGCVRK